MTRSRLIPPAAALLSLVAVAGCGSSGGAYGGGGGNASAASPAASVTAAKAPALAVRKTSLGKVIVDSRGRTLYMFGADTKNVSNCAGACATNWPPAAAPKKVKVGTGLSAKKVRAIKRSDGGRQISYAGHPLYRFAGDSKPGDVKGQGINAFGGIWTVVAPSGKAVSGSPPKSAPQPQPQPQTQPSYPSGGGY
jgi:predicted lipoprotein with Yx(FWY)xxD motif